MYAANDMPLVPSYVEFIVIIYCIGQKSVCQLES
jgi:hypothetical protein